MVHSPDQLPPAVHAAVEHAARHHSLPPSLILAQVTHESGGNPWAWNPEPRYRYFWDYAKKAPFRKLVTAEINSKTPPPDFPAPARGIDPDAEWWAQAASWGLMQVMGAVARELGFRGEFLTQLVDIPLNLDYGCRHMANQLRWSRGNIPQALAAYNGGRVGNETAPFRNQAYADKVLKLVV